MTQSLWLFGSRLHIVADHTTTVGEYDLIEGYFPPGTPYTIGVFNLRHF